MYMYQAEQSTVDHGGQLFLERFLHIEYVTVSAHIIYWKSLLLIVVRNTIRSQGQAEVTQVRLCIIAHWLAQPRDQHAQGRGRKAAAHHYSVLSTLHKYYNKQKRCSVEPVPAN